MKRVQINPLFDDNKELHIFIENLPEDFEGGGEIIWNGRNKIKKFPIIITNADGSVYSIVVKRFKRPGFIKAISYAIRRSKAAKAFCNGMELLRSGVDTPIPIACVEVTCSTVCKDMYYICGETNMKPIVNALERSKWDVGLATAFARFVAMLHTKGILHKDLNNTNVLYAQHADGSYSFSVIDINRMKFYSESKIVPLKICLRNLTLFTGCIDLFVYVLREYLNARGINDKGIERQGLRIKKAHDISYARRKKIFHPLRCKK
ncbi:MAG: hypothetical protein J1F13_05695 [Prevotellaceae bacterium]|nr:hypothetical protein [Prevotellaceae bacterium]